MFIIPFEKYENDLDTYLSNAKKQEILEILSTHNNLCSEEEFNEIEQNLHEACKLGDTDLIKIYLNEKIQNCSKDKVFKIDKTKKTASLFKTSSNDGQLIIPRSFQHESTEYFITSITGVHCDIRNIKFAEDSVVNTIYFGAFCNSNVEELYFPSSLRELKDGWCFGTRKLTKIIISPLNGQFIFNDDKCLLCKTDPNSDEFDNLLFVSRDIKEFSVPSNIKIISPYAFHNCENLNKVEIPPNSNLQTIGLRAFSLTNIKEIFIPPKVSIICRGAFAKCSSLTKIEIPPDSILQTIEKDAFCGSQVEEIYFPSSLRELKEWLCHGTRKLTKITISPSNGQFMFNDDKCLLCKTDPNSDEFDNLLFASRDIKELSIPSNIKIISPYAFHKCANLSKVEFPPNSNLQTIGLRAFYDLKINEIFIPPKVSIICRGAFSKCSNLTRVEIPPNSDLQIIEKDAFSESNIKEIFIPPKVSKICECAFLNCQYLTKVEIPPNSNLQTIESYAFCGSQVEEIYLPSSLRELKDGCFFGARKLTKITISPSNGQFIFNDDKCLLCKTDPNSDEFDNLLFASCDVKELSIPSNIKITSPCAFNGCVNLSKVEFPPNFNLQAIELRAFSFTNIEEILIPPKVSKICESAFYNCQNLSKVEFPPNSNLQTIGSYAFYNSKIKIIYIPSKVSKICEHAFDHCENLSKFEIPPNSNLQTIESGAFSYTDIEELYFPSSLRELKDGWCSGTRKLNKIIISPLNGQFIFNDDKCLLCKTDPNSDEFDNLLFVRRDIKEFSLPSNIKIISPYAFHNCENLNKVEIPPNSNLQTIGLRAFSLTNIKEIFIPPKVSKICECAFYNCKNLSKVEIPPNSNLQTIGSDAFYYLQIKDIFIPSNVSIIGENAFSFCENLQIVEISGGPKLKSFLLDAFFRCGDPIIMIPS